MSRRFGLPALAAGLFMLVSSSASPCTLVNGECPPGRIRNPGGLQMFQDIAYNSAQDFYLVVYQGGSNALGLKLTPGGSVGLEMVFGGTQLVQEVTTAYNPDRDEFLVVWRYDSPLQVWGRYVTGDANPIGNPFLIATGGTEPRVAYSTGSQRYVVVYSGIGLGTHFKVVAGDSTTPSPVLGGATVDVNGFSGRIAYSSASDRFLIVFVRDFAAPTRSEVWGVLLNGNGFGFLSGIIGIGGGVENQQIPEVGYSSTANQFMVAYEDWSTGGFPDVAFNLVTSSGVVGTRRNLTPGDPGWNVAGPVGFDPQAAEFIASYFNGAVSGFVREVKAATGALDRLILFGNLNSVPLGMAIRPHPSDPQAAVVWRNSFGEDGVHVSFIQLQLPPPVITQTTLPPAGLGVPYSQSIPFVGGAQPVTFSLISGSPPPGLSGPNAAGVVSGTANAIGNYPTFRVRATDSQGQFDEEDITLNVTLGTPTPLSPLGATNDTTPTFSWTATPTSTSYTLQVDNVTDGINNVINQAGIAGTSFTPGSALASGKQYRWRVQATDGVNVSPFSADTNFEVDTTPPAAVTTLSGSSPTAIAPLAGVTAIAVSAELSATFSKEKTVDGDLNTLWSTPGRKPMVNEFIALDLGASKLISRVRLRSRETLGSLLPRDFAIQVSPDNVNFTTVLSVLDFTAPNSPAAWFSFDFVPSNARYVKLDITETTQHTDTFHYVQINEIEIWSAPPLGSIQVTWTAPGDDGNVGTAAVYDIRYAPGSGPTINFDSATQAVGEPAPAVAGTSQSFLFSGLTPETFYMVGLKTIDDAGNVSGVSNTAIVASTGTPPGAITNLSTSNPAFTTMRVDWTAPAEDGPSGGAVTVYDLRYSTSPITALNFDSAVQVSGEPAPLAPGTPQFHVVTGLTSNTRYYFAMKSLDEVGNASPISNVPIGDTLDDVPPATVTNLAVTSQFESQIQLAPATAFAASNELSPHVKERVVDGDLTTIWSTPGTPAVQTEFITLDLGSPKSIARIRLRSRETLGSLLPRDFDVQVSNDGVSFTPAHSVVNFSAPNSPAAWYAFDFPPAVGRYVKLLITESTLHTDGLRYVQIAEVQVYQSTTASNQATLTWTATGDDGTLGTAAVYDVRYSGAPITSLALFDAATPVVGEPAPQAPGSSEQMTLLNLPGEMTLHFALRVVDESGNGSDVSNSPSLPIPPVSPGPVTDLAAGSPTATSMLLTWTSSGDDGTVGTATSYDVRYSTSPINPGNFDAATEATGEPVPAVSGTVQNLTVSALAPDTLYYFAMKVLDDVGNLSLLSNVASASTLDSIAPAAVNDLTATQGFVLSIRAATAIDASGELAPHVKERLVDGNLSTLWSTPGRGVMQNEHVTFDLGASVLVGRVRMRSRDTLGNLMPRDFQIQLADNPGGPFVTAHTVNDFAAPASPANWFAFDFTPASGRYLKILVTETNQVGGFFYVQMTEVEIHQATLQADRALLSWTATGDNGNVGTATSYELRYSTAPINDGNFGAATLVPGVPAPKPSGQAESFTVIGIPGESTVHFALKVKDEIPNTSGLSNVPSVVTPPIPPGAVTDLAASNPTGTSIRLDWTASGDDGLLGTATSYDIRYSTSTITEANFGAATQVVGEPVPAAAGTPQNMTVGSLTPETTYFFAMKTQDDTGAFSALSNVTSASTLDITAPSAVNDLTASLGAILTLQGATAIDASGELAPHVKERLRDGDLNTLWSTPGRGVMQNEHVTFDLGSSVLVGRVRLRSRDTLGNLMPKDFEIQLADNPGGPFTTAHTVNDFAAPASPANWFAFDFAPASGRYLKILVTETNSVGGLFYVQMTEVEIHQATLQADRALLSWTATGDNAGVGTAASYELRYSTAPINDGNFGAATLVPGVPAPKPAGQSESFTVLGVPGESTVYFALKVKDEVPNTSALSNVPSVVTPPIPPGAVTDLAASNPTGTSIRLDWAASGDDGLLGTATSYDVRYSTSTITEANFGAATQVAGEPAPAASGTPQNMTVGSLTPETTYFFAMKTQDDMGAFSALSNVVSTSTLDITAPSAVNDLMASPGAILTLQGATAIDASGELAPHVKERLRDGDLNTLWSTPGRGVMQNEHVTFDLGSSVLVGRVRLRSRDTLGNLMPKDFQIQLSDSPGGPFVTAQTVNDFVAPASPANWFAFDFAPASGRYLKILVTETNSVGGLFYVQMTEVEVYRATLQTDRVLVTWTSTGDNGNAGTAASYELRYSMAPINDGNFGAATLVGGVPAPKPAGQPESFTVMGLLPETTYFFALKVKDEVPNTSGLSNVPSVMTAAIAPAAVSNLAASNPTMSSIRLDWTSTGDDGLVGTATSYNIRYSTSAINEGNFAAATAFGGAPVPAISGTAQNVTVGSLNADTTYFFAMKVVDDVGASSPLSNVVSAKTLDVVAPAAVSDLSASGGFTLSKRNPVAVAASGELAPHVKERTVDGDLSTLWSTPGRAAMQNESITLDLGSVMSVARVRMRSRDTLGNLMPRDFQIQLGDNIGGPFTTALAVNDFVAPPSPAQWFTFDFTPASGRYGRILVTETNQVSNLFYVQITEIEVYQAVAQSDRVTLSWTAPGDNGATGTATTYDVRYSTSPIDAGNFAAATQATGEPAPQAAGATEIFTVTGLAPATTYYFAIQTLDEVPNASELSNVVSFTTP